MQERQQRSYYPKPSARIRSSDVLLFTGAMLCERITSDCCAQAFNEYNFFSKQCNNRHFQQGVQGRSHDFDQHKRDVESWPFTQFGIIARRLVYCGGVAFENEPADLPPRS